MTQQSLLENEHRDEALSQWFSPPDIAERFVRWTLDPFPARTNRRVLSRLMEPSCGNGSLLLPLAEKGVVEYDVKEILAFDIDAGHVQRCRERLDSAPYGIGECVKVNACDFLKVEPRLVGRMDVACMNPPYEGGQAEAHIAHASIFARSVCAIVQVSFLFSAEREGFWRAHDLLRMCLIGRPAFSGPSTGKSKNGMRDFIGVNVARRYAPRSREELIQWRVDMERWQ